jgi:hypothetical protein
MYNIPDHRKCWTKKFARRISVPVSKVDGHSKANVTGDLPEDPESK